MHAKIVDLSKLNPDSNLFLNILVTFINQNNLEHIGPNEYRLKDKNAGFFSSLFKRENLFDFPYTLIKRERNPDKHGGVAFQIFEKEPKVIGRGIQGVVIESIGYFVIDKNDIYLKLAPAACKIQEGKAKTQENKSKIEEIAKLAKKFYPHAKKPVFIHGRSYFFMEIIDGTSLEDYLEKNKITIEEGIAIITQLIEKLIKFHKQGFIHQDLQSSNIMWDGNEANIIDFDFSEPAEKHYLYEQDPNMPYIFDMGGLFNALFNPLFKHIDDDNVYKKQIFEFLRKLRHDEATYDDVLPFFKKLNEVANGPKKVVNIENKKPEKPKEEKEKTTKKIELGTINSNFSIQQVNESSIATWFISVIPRLAQVPRTIM